MRDVVITGIGIVSCAGEGLATHLAALASGASPHTDADTFAPHVVHPAVTLEWDREIPRKPDQRQMETWQRLGVYAAGLALEHAGIKGDGSIKSRMHLIVAAGGGERDYLADEAILTGLRSAPDPAVFLNERLTSDLRPTLFLAQLSNLLAGNVAIVHGVTGSSRTFMGEESSGFEALRVARERIAAEQVHAVLVGSSYNAERPDVLLIHEMGGVLWNHPFRSVWDRDENGGGFVLGSGACFVVLEAREHAIARGAKMMASFPDAASDHRPRKPGSVEHSLRRLWRQVHAGNAAAVISGATGISGITQEEARALRDLGAQATPHATGDLIGHTMEAQPVAGVALAAGLIAAGRAAEAVVTSVGHRRGEGLLRLGAVT